MSEDDARRAYLLSLIHISTIVLLIVLAVFKKKQTLVPKGFFVNGFEYIIEYVERCV